MTLCINYLSIPPLKKNIYPAVSPYRTTVNSSFSHSTRYRTVFFCVYFYFPLLVICDLLMIPLFSFLFHLFSEYRISYSYFLLIHPGIPSSPSPLLTSSCDNIFLDIVTLSLSLVFLAVLYVRVEKKTGFAKGSIPFLEYSIVRFFFVFLSLNTKNLFWTPSSFIYLFFLSFFFLLCFVFFFFSFFYLSSSFLLVSSYPMSSIMFS